MPRNAFSEQAVVAPPVDAALGVDALEVPDQQAAEVDAGRQARPAARLPSS